MTQADVSRHLARVLRAAFMLNPIKRRTVFFDLNQTQLARRNNSESDHRDLIIKLAARYKLQAQIVLFNWPQWAFSVGKGSEI
jgi:hypothetical protein